MKLARDGIHLSFDIAGAGPPAFLFVHGLGGDRTHFAPQMAYFARQGCVLNAELRGHGESDKPHQTYSIEGFAEEETRGLEAYGCQRTAVSYSRSPAFGTLYFRITSRTPRTARMRSRIFSSCFRSEVSRDTLT